MSKSIATTTLDPKILHKWLRADYEQGLVFWKHPRKGINVKRPVGCLTGIGYLKFQFQYTQTYVHRVIWAMHYDEWPDTIIDHINRVRSDNRIINLCLTNHRENSFNSKLFATNTTGIRGASVTPYGKYKITLGGQYLGNFDTREEAEDASRRYFETRTGS
jgi:hypothetical protein